MTKKQFAALRAVAAQPKQAKAAAGRAKHGCREILLGCAVRVDSDSVLERPLGDRINKHTSCSLASQGPVFIIVPVRATPAGSSIRT